VTVSSQEDNDLPSESDLRSRLVALMGGRAAEELLFHEVTGGAANDFEKANQIAATMVTRWGMGVDPEATELGRSGRGSLSFLVARASGNLPSDVQAAATRAMRAILDDAYDEACDTLVAHIDILRRISAHLVEEERVDGETFEALFDGSLSVPNAEAEWRPVTARPRGWAEVVSYHERRRQRPRATGRHGADSQPVPLGEAEGPALTPAELPVAAAIDADVAASLPATGVVDAPPTTQPALTPQVAPATAGEPAPVVADAEDAATGRAGAVAAASRTGRRAVATGRSKAARRLRGLAARHLRRAEAWLLTE